MRLEDHEITWRKDGDILMPFQDVSGDNRQQYFDEAHILKSTARFGLLKDQQSSVEHSDQGASNEHPNTNWACR